MPEGSGRRRRRILPLARYPNRAALEVYSTCYPKGWHLHMSKWMKEGSRDSKQYLLTVMNVLRLVKWGSKPQLSLIALIAKH